MEIKYPIVKPGPAICDFTHSEPCVPEGQPQAGFQNLYASVFRTDFLDVAGFRVSVVLAALTVAPRVRAVSAMTRLPAARSVGGSL